MVRFWHTKQLLCYVISSEWFRPHQSWGANLFDLFTPSYYSHNHPQTASTASAFFYHIVPWHQSWCCSNEAVCGFLQPQTWGLFCQTTTPWHQSARRPHAMICVCYNSRKCYMDTKPLLKQDAHNNKQWGLLYISNFVNCMLCFWATHESLCRCKQGIMPTQPLHTQIRRKCNMEWYYKAYTIVHVVYVQFYYVYHYY